MTNCLEHWRYPSTCFEVDYFVEYSQNPPAIPEPQPDEAAMKIGKHIADLIEDGSTIQLGIEKSQMLLH